MPDGRCRRPRRATSAPAEADFAPAPDEVARRAYFSYVNHGFRCPDMRSSTGWRQRRSCSTERNQTRVHGYHNPTLNRFAIHKN